MNAKDEILARIRTALADVPDVAAVPAEQDTPIAWKYCQPTAMDDVLDRFVERVEDYGATVVRCSMAEVPACITAALKATHARNVVLPAGLDSAWKAAAEQAGIELLSDEPALTHAQLNETHAVLTAACVGAAESGTIMLDHRADQGRRALTLVPDVHICVITAAQVVSDVPEAVGAIAESIRDGQPITWISGGSATSDIELSRVEGVHGPRTLYVILAQ